MWATKGNTYNAKNTVGYGSSMRWHLVYEDSIEYKEIEIGWLEKRKVNKPYGYLNCGRKNLPRPAHQHDYKMVLVLKDKININQSNVCSYCRKVRKKELGIEDRIEG